MPIERNGKHWCNPAAETPDENGRWVCSCGKVWTYDPAQSLWSPYVEPEPEPVPAEPEPDPEPVPADETEDAEGGGLNNGG
jgi:hypothetical protein